MIAEFALTDRQAEAILNMRLRALRKLEEMQIRKERDGLEKEQAELEKLVEFAGAAADPAQEGPRRACASATGRRPRSAAAAR